MEEKKIRQTLKKYLLGNTSENDNGIVDNWYNSFEDQELIALSNEESNATKEEIWEMVVPAMTPAKTIWISRIAKVAAMITVIVGAAITFLLLRNNKTTQNNPLAFTTISTAIGEKKKVAIKDGSQLILNAATTIRIQDDFSKSREIELVDGEVFFEVKTDAQKPFTIKSGELTTTVLGTSFNITAYKELHNVNIGVVSGKVSVANESATLSVLEKSQELVYNKNTKSYKKMALDEAAIAWQLGRLILNDLPFDEMTLLMKKNFGIDILTNDNSIRNTKYTTELFTSMSPAQAAEVLAAIHKLKIKEKDNQIFLYK